MTEQSLEVPYGDPYGYQRPGFGAVTVNRALGAAAGGGITHEAADFQRATSQIAATARVTGQPIGALRKEIQGLADTFPIGTQGAIATVAAVQQLGLVSKSQVPQLRSLSAEMVRLAGATGTAPAAMATSFGQLNRELASLDPSRVGRFGDVLTTVSARSGAAAMSIVNFARGIAPIAQQAGIGESAILGISSAFAKLGDDGGAAITAVNRILSDMNRSVRQGSNDLANYAQITGMTVDQFRKLATANPAQALASVTTSIGQAGPRGSYLLGTLGLDQARTQRALTELSQSGGLQAAIQQAVGAYGNGSTRQAAGAAFGGLLDSGGKLQSNFTALAQITGAPLLRPLTQLTNLSTALLHPLTALAGTSGVQNALGFGAQVGGGLLAARSVFGFGTRAAIAKQVGTSGVARGLVAGLMSGAMGGPDAARASGGFFARYAEPVFAAEAGGTLGAGFMGIPNRATYAGATRLGGLFSRLGFGTGAPGGPRLGLLGAGSLAYEAAMRGTAQPFRLANARFDLRSDIAQEMLVGRPGGATRDLTGGVHSAFRGGLADLAMFAQGQSPTRGLRDRFTEAGSAVRDFRAEVASSSKTMRVLNATMAAGKAMGGFAGSGALALGSGLARAAFSPLGLLGLGVGAYALIQHGNQQDKNATAQMSGMDIYSTLNTYRDSMGLAGEATVSFADVMKNAIATINASVTTPSAARTVTGSDVYAAGQQKGRVQQRYRGSNAQIAGQIAAENLQGMTPQDLQAVKLDLLHSGRSVDQVDQILAMVPSTGNGQMTQQQLTGIAAGGGSAFLGGHGDSAKQVWSLGIQALGQQQANNQQTFGPQYAAQQTVRSIGALVKAAGDPRSQLQLAEQLAQSYGVSGRAFEHKFGSGRVTDSSGNLYHGGQVGLARFLADPAAALGALGAKLGDQSFSSFAALAGGPTVSPVLQQNAMSRGLAAQNATALMPFFTAGATAGTQGPRGLVVQAQADPLDVEKQNKAVVAMTDAATKAGTSLGELSRQAGTALQGTGPDTVEHQLLAGIMSEAQFRAQSALPFMTPGQQYGAQANLFTGQASITGNDQTAQQQRAAGRASLQQLQAQTVESFHARLMAQYSFEVQSQRAEEDYWRGFRRTMEDNTKAIAREAQDAAKTMYDPYQRIQVQPVYDVVNLLGNEGEQLKAMKTQIANIRKLRGLGVSQQTIDQLSLYDPSKAQQVMELVADLQSDHSQVGRLNSMSAARQAAASTLMQMDPTFRRQQADLKVQLQRQHDDVELSRTRMAQDLHTSDLAITGDMTQLQADMNRILHGQQVDWSTTLVNGLKGTLAQVKKYAPQITSVLNGASGGGGGTGATGGYNGAPNLSGGVSGNRDTVGNYGVTSTHMGPHGQEIQTTRFVDPGTGQVVGGRMGVAESSSTDYRKSGGTNDYRPSDAFIAAHKASPQFNRMVAKSMMRGYGWTSKEQWDALDYLWTRESGWNQYSDNKGSDAYGIPQALPGREMQSAGSDWRTNPATQIKWGLDYIKNRPGYGDPIHAASHERVFGNYAAGGIAMSEHVGRVAEAGVPEAMIPLNQHGVSFLARALRSYMGADDAKSMQVAGAAIVIGTLNAEYHYDQGVHYHGDVHVQDSSPEAWAKHALDNRRREGLTGARGVAWQRTSS